jgi:hypothetical protein
MMSIVGTRAGEAAGLLGGHAYFLHWGVVQLSVANFVVIVAMLLVFLLAILVPFPHARAGDDAEVGDPDARD